MMAPGQPGASWVVVLVLCAAIGATPHDGEQLPARLVPAVDSMARALARANASDAPVVTRGTWSEARRVASGELMDDGARARARAQWAALRVETRALRYPEGAFSGDGVAIVGGGLRYYGGAEINARRLRDVGCALPIELWCLAAEAPTAPLEACRLAPLGVRVRVADAIVARLGGGFERRMPVTNKRYALKAVAVAFSAFARVLTLDADLLFFRDPTFLFDGSRSALAWPDFWRASASPLLQSVFGLPTFPGTHESGASLVDKAKHWRALLPFLYTNFQSEVFYYLTTSGAIGEGDKETLATALEWARAVAGGAEWREIVAPVTSVRPNDAKAGASGMVQHDDEGKPLFLHGNDPKFSVFDSANRPGNRAPRAWRKWNKAQVADLLGRAGGAAVDDLEAWARDALYDLGCDAGFRDYAEALLDAKRREGWALCGIPTDSRYV